MDARACNRPPRPLSYWTSRSLGQSALFRRSPVGQVRRSGSVHKWATLASFRRWPHASKLSAVGTEAAEFALSANVKDQNKQVGNCALACVPSAVKPKQIRCPVHLRRKAVNYGLQKKGV
jgi:hypothetical protein